MDVFKSISLITLFSFISLVTGELVGEELWPMPGRNEIPKNARRFFNTVGSSKKEFKLHIIGDTVEARGAKCDYKIKPLPKRDTYIYADATGHGKVFVLQDPSRENAYEAILSVRPAKENKGKYKVQAYYSLTRPKEPAFVNLIRIPDDSNGWSGDYSHARGGRFWGEKAGHIRSLIDSTKKPAFSWQGEVEKYAVLAFDGRHLSLFDCGLTNARTIKEDTSNISQSLDGYYLILSQCTGPGTVRVIQQMNIKGAKPEVLIEINDNDIKGISSYSLSGYLVPKAKVDELYKPEEKFAETWVQAKKAESKEEMSKASEYWAWIATHTKDEMTRLWSIEKFCMLQPYPGADLNPEENKILSSLVKSEPLEILYGKNKILAWPKDYLQRAPTKWRHLAEFDICMEWLKVWSTKNSMAKWKRRLISYFRTGNSKTSNYGSFKIKRSRKFLRFPMAHDGHEVSHAFVPGFLPITPNGFREGLTDFCKSSYMHFLGFGDYNRTYLTAFKKHMYYGGTVQNLGGYNNVAGFYCVIMDHCCRDAGGNLDWHEFTKLVEGARKSKVAINKNTDVEVRWQVFAELCEKVYGKKARAVFEGLGVPVSNAVIIDGTDDP